MIGYHLLDTTWGFFGYVAGPHGLIGTLFPQKSSRKAKQELTARWPNAVEGLHSLPGFTDQVFSYFDGLELEFDVPLDLASHPSFHQQVLKKCARIPYGEMISYGELARRAGNPRAGRAVGNCMNRNPMPLVIPCHRVIRSDGTIGGFGSESGVELKKKLLTWEGAI